MRSFQILLLALALLANLACGKPIGSLNQGGNGPPSGDRMVVSPVGNYGYVPGISSRQIGTYRIDSSNTFRMDPVGAVDARSTTRLVFHPNHVFAYVGKELDPRRGPAAIAVYRFDPATGGMTEAGVETLPNYSFGADLEISPDGRYLVVGIAGGQGPGRILIYSIDSTSGLLALKQNLPLQNASDAVRIRADGKWLYSLDSLRSQMLILSYDATSGSIALQATIASPDRPTDFELHPSGLFAYVGNVGGAGLTVYSLGDEGGFTVLETPTLDNNDLASGFSAPDLQAPGVYVSAIALSRDGRFIYVNMPCYRVIHVFEIDPTTGHLTHIDREEDVSEGCVRGLTLSITSDGLYAIVPTGETTQGSLVLYYRIDPITGVLRRLGLQEWAN